MTENQPDLGRIIKQQRLAKPLTLKELSDATGISPSHLGRIERGERFPSARVLRKIAGPLGFKEGELFTWAGYLSTSSTGMAEDSPKYSGSQLDPYVAKALAQEPIEVQRAVVGLLTLLKSIAKGLNKKEPA